MSAKVQDITSFDDLGAVKTSMTSADFSKLRRWAPDYFSSIASILPTQIQKKSQKNIPISVRIRIGGLQYNTNLLAACTRLPARACATRSRCHVDRAVQRHFCDRRCITVGCAVSG